MHAIVGFALGEGLLLAIIGRRQVVDARQQCAIEFSVVDDAANRGAAEADAMIAARAADQAGAAALAADLMIGERDLQCGVRGLRAGIAEEHIFEAFWRELSDPAG